MSNFVEFLAKVQNIPKQINDEETFFKEHNSILLEVLLK